MANGARRIEELEAEETGSPYLGSTLDAFEQALAGRQPRGYVLTLYVAGAAPRSLRAIANVRRLCQEHLSGCHELQVVDIYQEPAVAEEHGVLAVPALVKQQPLPARSFIGDMSDFDRILKGLGLSCKSGSGD